MDKYTMQPVRMIHTQKLGDRRAVLTVEQDGKFVCPECGIERPWNDWGLYYCFCNGYHMEYCRPLDNFVVRFAIGVNEAGILYRALREAADQLESDLSYYRLNDNPSEDERERFAAWKQDKEEQLFVLRQLWDDVSQNETKANTAAYQHWLKNSVLFARENAEKNQGADI